MADQPMHRIMAEELVMQKVRDMKARADILSLDGQALLAKAETIRYEAMCLENDLYKFKLRYPEAFKGDPALPR